MIIRPTGEIKVDFRIAKINYIKKLLDRVRSRSFHINHSALPIIILPQADHHSALPIIIPA